MADKPLRRMTLRQLLTHSEKVARDHGPVEILVNNNFVNPMTIQVPRGLQLTGRQLAEFQRERNRIETLMQMDPVTSRVAQAN